MFKGMTECERLDIKDYDHFHYFDGIVPSNYCGNQSYEGAMYYKNTLKILGAVKSSGSKWTQNETLAKKAGAFGGSTPVEYSRIETSYGISKIGGLTLESKGEYLSIDEKDFISPEKYLENRNLVIRDMHIMLWCLDKNKVIAEKFSGDIMGDY